MANSARAPRQQGLLQASYCIYVTATRRASVVGRRTDSSLHHLRAFALGGEHTAENIALRCRAHNTLAAEEDFGKELIERAKDSSDHQT